MRKLISLVFLTLFLCLPLNISAQDYSKLIELQKKISSIQKQLMSCEDDTAKEEQLIKELEKLSHQLEDMMTNTQQNINTNDNSGYPFHEIKNAETRQGLMFYKSLFDKMPKELYKIHVLYVNMNDSDPLKQPDEVNKMSNEIILEMGKIYTAETPIEFDTTAFTIGLTFCKEVTISYTIEAHAYLEDGYDFKYETEVTMEGVWISNYLVDVVSKKGVLVSHSILSQDPEIKKPKVTVSNLSGWRKFIRIDAGVLKGPVDRYEIKPGTETVVIGPMNLSQIKNVPINPKDWPDELVNEYTVACFRPTIEFSCSAEDPSIPAPIISPCMPEFVDIKPEEFNKAIRDGYYTKTITGNYPAEVCASSKTTLKILFAPLICDDKGDPGAIAVSGACIDHGGYILTTEDDVIVEGKPVARVGDKVICLKHGITKIVGDKDVKVFSEKKRIARVGDKTECGAVIMGGSISVYAGDKKKK